MSVSIRTMVAFLAVGFAQAALAGDAYYVVPVHELKFTDGSLPVRKERAESWRHFNYMRLQEMQPYAALDGPGEVYVAGEAEPRDTWTSTYPIPRSLRPDDAWQRIVGHGTQLFVRTTADKDVTGRLFVPNAELTGMVALKFTIPASDAKPEAKSLFTAVKLTYYECLQNRDIPGGAWFRHQVRLARSEINLPKPDEAQQRPASRFDGRDELTRTYELFTGGRALSENLQLDRALPPRRTDEEPVKLASLSGITIQEIDWKPLIGDAKPKLDPLARKIPADQHVVFFPSFQAAIATSDETNQYDTPVLRLAQPRSENARIVERYQRQLGLSLSTVARLPGPTLAKSVALTGADPFFPTGTDVAVLFESPQPAMLESLLAAKIALAAAQTPDAKPVSGEVGGLKYHGFLAPDRNVSSYIARLDGAVVVTNSTHQLATLAAVRRGESKSIADLPEYVFFRIRYPLHDPAETALAFLSDATIRRWCGPRWRIGDSRRTRARAVLAELQASQLDSLVKKTVKPGPIHTDLPLLGGGELAVGPSGVVSTTFGTLDFMTPIAEISLDECTKAEADAYQAWRDGYQRNWSWAFDPVALRIGLGKQKLSADMTIMPLIASTQYREFISIAQGGAFQPTDGDRHDAPAQFMLAVNRESPMFRHGENFMTAMGQAISLGWIGKWLNVFADADPFWKDLAAQKPEEREKFLQSNIGRLPIAARLDSSNPLKLAAFLTGVRAFSEQTAPGLLQWESLKYHDQPYVRVSPKKGTRTLPSDLENVVIYYTTVDSALTVTLNERVLQGSIDRALARQKASGEGKADLQDAKPWLGSSAALQVDQKILEIVNAATREQYESTMRTLSWNSLPILNEWKRLYPDRDPVQVHREVWGVELVCPGGGKYVWNPKFQTMESTVYGHPGELKHGPPAPPVLSSFATANFGLTLENQGLRARVVLERPADKKK